LPQLCTLLSQGITNKGDLIYALYGKKPGNLDKDREMEQEFTQLMKRLVEQSAFGKSAYSS
jgi:hypothetical protein